MLYPLTGEVNAEIILNLLPPSIQLVLPLLLLLRKLLIHLLEALNQSLLALLRKSGSLFEGLRRGDNREVLAALTLLSNHVSHLLAQPSQIEWLDFGHSLDGLVHALPDPFVERRKRLELLHSL